MLLQLLSEEYAAFIHELLQAADTDAAILPTVQVTAPIVLRWTIRAKDCPSFPKLMASLSTLFEKNDQACNWALHKLISRGLGLEPILLECPDPSRTNLFASLVSVWMRQCQDPEILLPTLCESLLSLLATNPVGPVFSLIIHALSLEAPRCSARLAKLSAVATLCEILLSTGRSHHPHAPQILECIARILVCFDNSAPVNKVT